MKPRRKWHKKAMPLDGADAGRRVRSATMRYLQEKYRRHAIERFAQRYGEPLEDEQYDALCKLIAEGKSFLHWPSGEVREVHVLKVGHRHIGAVWSIATQRIVTFLFPEKVATAVLASLTPAGGRPPLGSS